MSDYKPINDDEMDKSLSITDILGHDPNVDMEDKAHRLIRQTVLQMSLLLRDDLQGVPMDVYETVVVYKMAQDHVKSRLVPDGKTVEDLFPDLANDFVALPISKSHRAMLEGAYRPVKMLVDLMLDKKIGYE